MKSKSMLTNPNFYLFCIFVLATLLAISSFLQAYFASKESKKSNEDLNSNIGSVQQRVMKLNNQLDSVSFLLANDFNKRYDKLIKSVDEFQKKIEDNKQIANNTLTAITNPHHPFDLEIHYTIDLTKMKSPIALKEVIEFENQNKDLSKFFQEIFPSTMVPFFQDENGKVLSISQLPHYDVDNKKLFDSHFQYFFRSNFVIEEALNGVALIFSSNNSGYNSDEYYSLDYDNLIVNNKLDNIQVRIDYSNSEYPNGQLLRIKLKITDVNFGNTNGKILSLDELMKGKILLKFDNQKNPIFHYAILSFGKTAKKHIYLNYKEETPSTKLMIDNHSFLENRYYIFSDL
jgi:hypothetical protein